MFSALLSISADMTLTFLYWLDLINAVLAVFQKNINSHIIEMFKM